MRVAIISSLFFESTFPLAKHLSAHHQVTLYCFLNGSLLNPPMLDLNRKVARGVYNHVQSIAMLPEGIREYFNDTDISFRVVVCGSSKSIGFMQISRLWFSLWNSKFDYFHFIGQEFRFGFVQFFLPKRKVIQTLHEANIVQIIKGTGKLKSFLVKKFFENLEIFDIKLIFHSDNVRDLYIKEFPRKSLSLIAVIPFGLFESYKFIDSSKCSLKVPESPYFLFYGYIEQYKGVDVLLKATDILNQLSLDIKCVIAGRDNKGLLSTLHDSNVVFYNKFLTEEEIVFLIKNSMAVVLPYRVASQSGIPNTCFLFSKPIIASDIPGLNEVIKDMVNGLLFPKEDSEKLVECILKIYTDEELRHQLASNIENFEGVEPLKWSTIAGDTAAFYLKEVLPLARRTGKVNNV